jgi:flagellar motor switch protein FliG
MNREGTEKSAILLLSLGEEAAAQVFRYLSPTEVSELGRTMRDIGALPRERVENVLREYTDEAGRQTGFGTDSEEFLDAALTRALGDDRGRQLMTRILGKETDDLKQLEWMEPAEVAGLLQDEHPQVVATVLVHLDRQQASRVLEWLNEPLRHEVVQRVAEWRGVPAEAMRELNAWLAKRLRKEETETDGEVLAAELLQHLSPAVRTQVESGLASDAPELLGHLKARQLGMEDMKRLTPESRTRFFKVVPGNALLLALKGADPDMVESLLHRMPETAARRLKDDLEALGAARLDEIDTAQDEVVRLLREMAAKGELEIRA